MELPVQGQDALEQAEFERSLRQDLPKNLMDEDPAGRERDLAAPVSPGSAGQIQRRERRFPAGAGRVGEDASSDTPCALPTLRRARPDMRRAPAQVALKFNPNQIRDMSAAQVKKCSAKIMSLPCTVVSSASGSLEVLDLNRLHYVTHRLALGTEGLKELVAVEKRVLGASEFEDSSNLSVFAVPTMDFEEGSKGPNSVTHLMSKDKLVRDHITRMDTTIEQFRTRKLGEVTRYRAEPQRVARAKSFANMSKKAQHLSPFMQELVDSAVETAHEIVRNNPGYSEHETMMFRAPSLATVLPNALRSPREGDSSTSGSLSSGGGSMGTRDMVTARRIRFVADEDSCAASPVRLPSADGAGDSGSLKLVTSDASAGEIEGKQDGQQHLEDATSGRLSSKWDRMRDSVQTMADRWQYIEKFRKRNPGGHDMKVSNLMDRSNIMEICCGVRRPAGAVTNAAVHVFVSKCTELGVVPNSKVIEMMQAECADMVHASMGDRGASAFMHALSCNAVIRTLSVKDNKLSSQGFLYVLNGILRRADPTGSASVLRTGSSEAATRPVMISATKCNHSRYEQLRRTGQRGDDAPAGTPTEVRKARARKSKQAEPAEELATGVPISELNASQNPIGSQGAMYLARILNIKRVRTQFLCRVILDQCHITDSGGQALMASLTSNDTLHTLVARQNKMGNMTAQALGDMLLQNSVLTNLNIAWNVIGPVGAGAIATGITFNSTLEALDLSWNGLENDGCSALAAALAENHGLRNLDLSCTRMGAPACSGLGQALCQNTTIDTLLVNGNAIGEKGAQMLAQALTDARSLRHLGMQDNADGWGGVDEMSAPVVLDPQCPQGTYTLSLGQKAERAVALGLIRLDAEAEGGPGQHLRNVRLNGNEVGALTERGWPDKLPALGLLEADFTRLPELAVQHVLDFKKVANLEREFQKDSTTDLTKMKTLLTVAPYSYLYAAQIAKLLRCIGTGDMLVRAACVLFTRCVDLEDGGYTTILRALPERDQYFVRLTLGSTGCFKGSNPTGHYELNLSIAAQRMLAVRLKDAALDEGQAHTWRNVLYERTTETMRFFNQAGPPKDWATVIPQAGVLTLDYLSSRLAPTDATIITDAGLAQLLRDCGVSLYNGGPKLPAVPELWPDAVFEWRCRVCRIWLTCGQITWVMGCLSAMPDRVEVLVSSWARCVDRRNVNVPLMSLSGLGQNVAMTRIGPGVILAACPAVLSYNWFLDCACAEHNDVASHLIKQTLADATQNWFHLKLSGRPKAFQENASMVGFLTTDTKTPIIHVSTLFGDAWGTLCKVSDATLANMSANERTDVRTRVANRRNLDFVLEWSPYFSARGECRAGVPEWASRAAMMQPLIGMPPWVAAWYRTVRKIVRLKQRDSESRDDALGASPLEEAFYAATNGASEMGRVAFEAWAAQTGHAPSKQRWLCKEMLALLEGEDGRTTISFAQFSELARKPVPNRLDQGGSLVANMMIKRFVENMRQRIRRRKDAEATAAAEAAEAAAAQLAAEQAAAEAEAALAAQRAAEEAGDEQTLEVCGIAGSGAGNGEDGSAVGQSAA